MKFTSNYQLRKGQFRSWLKLRQHERLENEDSFSEDTKNPEGNQLHMISSTYYHRLRVKDTLETGAKDIKQKESTTLIDMNVSNTELN